jgi:uncharacterized protein (TIGR02271 family)
MSEPKTLAVISKDGARGVIVDEQPDDSGAAQLLMQFESGQQVLAPAEVLVEQADGSYYYLPIRLDDLSRQREENVTLTADKPLVLPVVAEEIDVRKRTVETGKVRVRKIVQEQEEVVDEPLLHEEVQIERVPVNRVVKSAMPVHQEGDTLIIPLFEEVLVVEKRLMLREELHVTKRRTTTHQPQQVTLRREDVTVERIPSEERERGADAE